MSTVRIGNRPVGVGHPCYIIAEIGINHNGDVDIAKRLIAAAVWAGCDAVKFQKRTVDVVYTAAELAAFRESPFGLTNGQLKYGLEFEAEEYQEIDRFCKSVAIVWFASCWDESAVDFMGQFELPAYKIASASLTDEKLLKYVRKTGKPIIASTGMSTPDEIDTAVRILGGDDLILMHCTSTYPANSEHLNLRAIAAMAQRYAVPVGYSGHEIGIAPSVAASVLGAHCIERHITLDRAMWGSDQKASLEPDEMQRLVSDIRLCEQAMGDGIKRVYQEEVPVMRKLRRVGATV